MKKVTVITELQREFALLCHAFKEKLHHFLSARPRQVFSGMLMLMCASGIYVFLVIQPAGHPVKNKPPGLAVNDFSGESVGETYAKLKTTLRLQNRVQVLLAKDSLNHSDSLNLAALLNEIQKIQHDKLPK